MTRQKNNSTKTVTRIISIGWKKGIDLKEAKARGWVFSNDLDDTKFLTLYCEHSRFGTRIHYWKESSEYDGKLVSNTYAMQDRNLFDEPWKHPDSGFAGSLETAQAVLSLGIPELYPQKKLAKNQRLEVERFCEIYALCFKQCIQTYPNDVLIIFRSVYEGEIELTLADAKKLSFGQIESFEPVDDLEVSRMIYRTDENLEQAKSDTPT